MMKPATLVLDGEMTAKEVKARLTPSDVLAGLDVAKERKPVTRDDDAAVVIRRRHEGDILWYVRTVAEVRAAVEGAKANETLTELLDLHEHQKARTRELRVVVERGDARFKGVVLDGERVAGVVIEPDRAPAPAARAPEPSGDESVDVLSEDDEEMEIDEGEMGIGRGGGRSPIGGRRRGSRGPVRGGGDFGAAPRTRGGATRSAPRSPAPPAPAPPPPPAPAPPRARRAPTDSPAGQPQRAFPLLRAPELVKSKQEFALTVGLAKAPVKGVTGDALTINIPIEEETITLDVQVAAAEGFTAPKGWRHPLTLKTSNIYRARLEIPLTAPDVTGESLFSILTVHFSHDGVHLGTATRRIEVAQAVGRSQAASPWVHATPRPAAMNMDLAERAPDLTIRIEKPDADEATGKFVWTFETPHQGVTLPATPLPMNLGTDAKTFAKALITLIDENSGGQLLTGTMRGIGMKISQKIPADAWRVLAEVASKVSDAASAGQSRPTTVLLYSAETSVPWELAVMPSPLDSKKPEYLGAQVALGRWILGTNGPSVPPARAVNIDKMAIVTGYYKAGSNLERLKGAEQESKQLQTAYKGLGLDATPENVRQLFEGTMAGAEHITAIHFACHGEVQPDKPELNAIYLSDGSPLNEFVFLGARIGQRTKPILFLNACQVGTQGEMLGESAGFGAGCLYAGFRAFVAPLWSVDDATAREIALDFYRTSFDAGKPTFVSSFFQDTRCKFVAKSATAVPESTYLAYVYYGHPELLLST
jgi:hypothetical protein